MQDSTARESIIEENKRPPFQGIRAVELQGMLAGAFCGAILADFGMDIIKFEPLQGDKLRGVAGAFQALNRGKRSIAVDLSTEEGRHILHRYVKTCDVMIQNFRPGAEKRMGADYEAVCAVNPNIIYYSASGYGLKGPDAMKPGYDYVLQGRSGISRVQGGGDGPPVLLGIPIVDQTTALLGAYAVTTALFARRRTGKGQLASSSLLSASIAVQSGDAVSYPGMTRDENRMGTWGINALYRIYRTRDGYIFLSCSPDDEKSWSDLCKATDQPTLARDTRFDSALKRRNNDAALAHILSDAFRVKTSGEWLESLENLGIVAAPANDLVNVSKHPQMIREKLFFECDAYDLGRINIAGVLIKLLGTPGRIRSGAPLLGQNTQEILGDLGYTEEEIGQLRARRIIL